MKIHRFGRAVFALAFVLSQLFAVFHATRHELLDRGASDGCSICAVAHAPGAPASTVVLKVTAVPEAGHQVASLPEAIVAAGVVVPPSRGPPPLLA